MVDERTSPFRRSINSLGMRDGQPEESKLFATVGKGFCIWFLYKYGELLILHENVLFVLLLFLIMPELIKKFFAVRFGGAGGPSHGYTERTDRTEHTVTAVTAVPAAPPAPRKVDVPEGG